MHVVRQVPEVAVREGCSTDSAQAPRVDRIHLTFDDMQLGVCVCAPPEQKRWDGGMVGCQGGTDTCEKTASCARQQPCRLHDDSFRASGAAGDADRIPPCGLTSRCIQERPWNFSSSGSLVSGIDLDP